MLFRSRPCCSTCRSHDWPHRPLLASAKIQMRSRKCWAPQSAAESTHHSASNPISAKSPRTTPSPREVSIGEFSTNTNRGRTSLIILAISRHRPLRSPSSPAPFPAALMSWQGKPPETTSTVDRKSTRLNSSHIQKSRMPSSA